LTNLNIDDAFSLLEDSIRIEGSETDSASETVQSDAESKTIIFNRI
jgi:hypothetical protein